MVVLASKIIVAAAVVAAIALTYFYWLGSNAPGEYDAFAQCLSSKGAKIYGAYWCPHCNDQKKSFGTSWRFVSYVECSLPNNAGQTPACSSAGIANYPTWEFAGGKRAEGVLSFDRLAAESGCALNATK